MKRALLISALCFPNFCFGSGISDRDAVRAIIGEGANQSDAALAGIASAIHNRGTLRGVFGLSNPVVDTASDALWARAIRSTPSRWTRSNPYDWLWMLHRYTNKYL